MMLRVSSKTTGKDVDIDAVMGADASSAGVPHGDLLVAFAEAAVAAADERDGELAAARHKLEAAAGPGPLVDAAAVVANFQRMVRVADGTGIPLDKRMNALTAGMREDLGIDQFGSAVNTAKVGSAAKAAGRLLQGAAIGALKIRKIGLAFVAITHRGLQTVNFHQLFGTLMRALILLGRPRFPGWRTLRQSSGKIEYLSQPPSVATRLRSIAWDYTEV